MVENNQPIINSKPASASVNSGIESMPAYARVWVYQNDKEYSAEQLQAVENAGIAFINEWTAHGESLKATFDILYNRFVVIAVDEQQALASGCSIDKSVHFIKYLEKQFNLNLFDRMQVAYRNGNEIKACHITKLLDELTSQSDIGNDKNKLSEVIVFNNMVTTKAEFDTKWEVPLKDSWQSRILN